MIESMLPSGYKPEFDSFRVWLVEIAQIRSVEQLLNRVVTLLAGRPHVSMARIWLLKEHAECTGCDMEPRCQKDGKCLQLVASAGTRKAEGRPDWSRIDGEYSRIPPGVGKVGRVAATGEEVVVKDFGGDPMNRNRYPWASHHQIRGLDLQPIKFGGEVLGVIGVFTSIPTPAEAPVWLRIFADVIASSLINARAFEEIDRLRSQLELQNVYLQEEVWEAKSFGSILGQHPQMRRLIKQIEMVAPTDANVLILGESGTGKELVAREVHRRSTRRDKPLIRVNCASVPKELYESEFFGHVRGAFTGALKDRLGRFQAADGGTLFLDEVGEIPLALQSKLLRVLQEQQYERVGEEKTRSVDVRIIAATNCDLKKAVEQGLFREDLYYRLNVFPLEVPPLRQRREDIPLLAAYFVASSARRLLTQPKPLSEEQIRTLKGYNWPGNVRELQNAVERAVISSKDGWLHFDLPGANRDAAEPVNHLSSISADLVLTDEDIQKLQKRSIEGALERCGWRVHGPAGAAAVLKVKPTTLISRMKKLGIGRRENQIGCQR